MENEAPDLTTHGIKGYANLQNQQDWKRYERQPWCFKNH